MKELAASVLAVDTKLPLKGFLTPGGPTGIIAGLGTGQLGHGDSVLLCCAFSHGQLQRPCPDVLRLIRKFT